MSVRCRITVQVRWQLDSVLCHSLLTPIYLVLHSPGLLPTSLSIIRGLNQTQKEVLTSFLQFHKIIILWHLKTVSPLSKKILENKHIQWFTNKPGRINLCSTKFWNFSVNRKLVEIFFLTPVWWCSSLWEANYSFNINILTLRTWGEKW